MLILTVVLMTTPSWVLSVNDIVTGTMPYSNDAVPQIKPRYLRKVERDNAKRERDQKKGYKEAVKENQKRSIEIQTPEVQERMKQNKKNANAQAKAKRKTNRSRTKNNARKYR